MNLNMRSSEHVESFAVILVVIFLGAIQITSVSKLRSLQSEINEIELLLETKNGSSESKLGLVETGGHPSRSKRDDGRRQSRNRQRHQENDDPGSNARTSK